MPLTLGGGVVVASIVGTTWKTAVLGEAQFSHTYFSWRSGQTHARVLVDTNQLPLVQSGFIQPSPGALQHLAVFFSGSPQEACEWPVSVSKPTPPVVSVFCPTLFVMEGPLFRQATTKVVYVFVGGPSFPSSAQKRGRERERERESQRANESA